MEQRLCHQSGRGKRFRPNFTAILRSCSLRVFLVGSKRYMNTTYESISRVRESKPLDAHDMSLDYRGEKSAYLSKPTSDKCIREQNWAAKPMSYAKLQHLCYKASFCLCIWRLALINGTLPYVLLVGKGTWPISRGRR